MCKRKAIVLAESDIEINDSMSPNIGDAGEDESTNSSKKNSPFLLFGFIIDPHKGIQHAYSCNFCSRKFLTPQALGGHQNSHKLERRLKKRTGAMNTDSINHANSNQGVVSLNTVTPYHGAYGYQYNEFNNMIQLPVSLNFDARNFLVPLQDIPKTDEVINDADQSIVRQQATMTEVDYGSISNGCDAVEDEVKETQEEEAIQDYLILKL
ncbi:zinc finger protein [Trifolium pratense]|uniref:Zinc finger protein n=1 Tax=Trifolium pratense TaxID=57577 RepID=A0A2K3L7J1_TRIPR|nr:zinc finger protein [Trifolium pratense]